jgi:hypothetical protein
VRDRLRDFGVLRTVGLTPHQATSSLAGAHARRPARRCRRLLRPRGRRPASGGHHQGQSHRAPRASRRGPHRRSLFSTSAFLPRRRANAD